MDRLIGLITYSLELALQNYSKLDKNIKDKIMLVTFEEIITDPYPLCENIAEFIGSKTTQYTKKILRKEKCPRVHSYVQNSSGKYIIDPDNREEKMLRIEKNATPKYRDMFFRLIEKYESKFLVNLKE